MKKERVLKIYQTYRLYIFPGIVALSSLILIVFVIYPQIGKLISNKQAEGEIITKSKFLEVKAQALQSYDPIDLERSVEFALGAYPTDKDFISGISLLQDLTIQSGFSIVSIILGGSSQSTNGQSYSIKLDIIGPNQLLSKLLSNIENSPRLMRINSIEVVTANSQQTTVSLNVEVLYSSAPQEFGSNDSPLPQLSAQDEEVIVKLAENSTSVSSLQITPQLGPRGKENPFE